MLEGPLIAQCPVCQSSVPDDFGLIECTKCGAVLFVEFDGKVTARNNERTEVYAETSPEPEVDVPEFDNHFEATGFEETVLAPPPPPPIEEDEVFEELMPQSIVAPVPPPATGEEHMDDLQQFANSPASQGREGLLQVNLVISGIDTADIRNSVHEALTDKKFLWDADGLIKSIHAGRLHIQDLPSVKAAILISRLKSIPVNVSWEQHAIHQA